MSTQDKSTSTGNQTRLCVFCRRHPVEHAWRPFCSQRCKLQDLAHWADGSYAVPGEPLPEPNSESEHTDKSNG